MYTRVLTIRTVLIVDTKKQSSTMASDVQQIRAFDDSDGSDDSELSHLLMILQEWRVFTVTSRWKVPSQRVTNLMMQTKICEIKC